MNKILPVSILALSLTACGTPGTYRKQDVGAVTGGVIGGVIGSTIGHGNGRIVGGAVGALVGALIGGSIGSYMDQTDQLNAQLALERNRTNQPTTWINPDSNVQYEVIPTKTYVTYNGQYCREYQTTAIINGKKQRMYGQACRQSDGSWKQVP